MPARRSKLTSKASSATTDRIFRGWVPTVSGALSFSTFGDVSHKPRAISANRADRKTRYLISFRARDCSDVLLPFKSTLAPWFLNLTGKLWFVCVASSRTIPGVGQDEIVGKVLVFHSHELWRNNAEIVIRNAQAHLRNYRYGTHGEIDAYFETTFQSLLDELPALSAFNADFSIARTGIAELRLPVNMEVHATAPRLPDNERSREHVQHVLTAQLFFFLRDIGHRHQHHDPNTDTIVDLWPDEPNDPLNWKLQTLFSLYRKVISYKRIRSRGSFAASLGVIAYADTFRKIIEETTSEKERARFPRFFSSHVIASIQAVDAEVGRAEELMRTTTAVTRELILASIALIIAVIGVFQITDYKLSSRPAQILYFLGDVLVTQPILTIAFTAGLIGGIRLLLRNPANNSIVRLLFRLSQPFDIRVTIGLFALLTAFAVWLIYILLVL